MQNQYSTLAEYRQRIPAFTCVQATEDGSLQTQGTTFDIAAGTEFLIINRDAESYLEKSGKRSARQLEDVYRPYSGEDLNGKRLIVWRSGGIGDLLWLRPILCHLKTLYPESTIALATRSMFHDMVMLWVDCIDELSSVPMNMDDVAKADYQFSFEGLVERCLDSVEHDIHDLLAAYAGLDPGAIEWCKPMMLPAISPDNPCLEFMKSGKYVSVQYRASAATRTPLFRTIITAINAATHNGYNVIIPDTKDRARDIDNLISCCDHPDRICNFAYYSPSLVDMIRLVTNARLVIAPDSAQMHVAAMQGTPAIGLYGPFPGKLRCSRYPKAQWIEPEPSRCCGFGGKACFLPQYIPCQSNHACWRNMDNRKLGELVKEVLCADSKTPTKARRR